MGGSHDSDTGCALLGVTQNIFLYTCLSVLCSYTAVFLSNKTSSFNCNAPYLIADEQSDSAAVQDGRMQSERLVGDYQNWTRNSTSLLLHKLLWRNKQTSLSMVTEADSRRPTPSRTDITHYGDRGRPMPSQPGHLETNRHHSLW